MTDQASQESSERAGSSSVGALLGGVTRDFSKLMRQEVELAKAEAKESATRAGKGVGLYGGAGVAGHMALLFLTLAIWWALGDAIESLAWSGVIIAVIYGIIALVLYTRGRKEIKNIKGMPQTADSIKRIPESLKPEDAA